MVISSSSSSTTPSTSTVRDCSAAPAIPLVGGLHPALVVHLEVDALLLQGVKHHPKALQPGHDGIGEHADLRKIMGVRVFQSSESPPRPPPPH